MRWFEKLEGRLGWLAFPGLLKFYVLLHGIVFGLQWMRPDIGQILEFDREKIFSGEVWRTVTFLFASSGMGNTGLLSVLFFVCMVMIAFLINDALESAWGVLGASLFYYTGIACLVGANFVFDNPLPGSGMMLYASAFLAFATLFPRMEFLLFVVPVQVRFLAWIQVAGMVLLAFTAPLLFVFYPLVFANYLIWGGIPALRGKARVLEASRRRGRFDVQAGKDAATFHECAACGRTEADDVLIEFRVCNDGKEYCDEHLPDSRETAEA
ncbi:MAG: hypothetical protein V4733_04970 [Verrucomicrobiota bacterium]